MIFNNKKQVVSILSVPTTLKIAENSIDFYDNQIKSMRYDHVARENCPLGLI